MSTPNTNTAPATLDDVIQIWRNHPGFREVAIAALVEFMDGVDADNEPTAQHGSVGPEGQHGSCIPPSASPSGSFSPAAPPKPKRRAGRTPRTDSHALPVAEEAAL